MKIRAHPDFRFVTTMNDDASTFELPDYVNSRLTPTILVDFPDEEEELAILAENLPFAPQALLKWVTRFLKSAHEADEPFSVRDGINIARYALKRLAQGGGDPLGRLLEAVRSVLGDEAAVHAPARAALRRAAVPHERRDGSHGGAQEASRAALGRRE